MENSCIFCGAVLPEGRIICPVCEYEATARMHPPMKILGMKDAEDIANAMCAEYCKYPDEYSSLYDDPDEAIERCAIEKCENCPMTELRADMEDDK